MSDINVNPGELDKKIIIFQEIPGEKNENGYSEKSRETVRRPWAAVNRISGTEKIESGTTLKDVNMRFLVRFSKKTVDTSMFVEYRKKIYNIVYVNNYGDNDEYIEIITNLRE